MPVQKKLLETLPKVIQQGEILWQSKTNTDNVVVKCNQEVVVKIVPSMGDYTEFTSLQYLADHVPEIPAPKPLGLIGVGDLSYVFMSFIGGTTLERAWPGMLASQKKSITEQLNKYFLRLRQQQCPDGVAFGGVSGEGCKDTRRHTRICTMEIRDCSQFQDFQFSMPNFGGWAYVEFLRNLLPRTTSLCVFMHGDVRPENIMVQLQDDGEYKVTGLLDWEKSGFYPDYFECTKITSTMSTSETDDWFLHLPRCISPTQHPARWLLDRLWDKHVA